MRPLTPEETAGLRETMAAAQRGDLRAARRRGEGLLAASDGHPAVAALLGLVCLRGGDPAAGIDHLGAALAANPGDPTIATNLATALVETGRAAEVPAVATVERCTRDAAGRLWRLRAFGLLAAEDFAGATSAYRRVVATAPNDAEAWNNLGNALVGAGDHAAAREAQARAAALDPLSGPIQLNYAATLAAGGDAAEAERQLAAYLDRAPDDARALVEHAALLRHLVRDAEALDRLRRAVALLPDDADLRVQLGEEAAAAWRFDEAEAAIRAALRLQPSHARAHVQLAMLLEHTNRDAELPDLIAAGEAAGVDAGALALLRALAARRAGTFEEGLAALSRVPDDLEPIRRAQLEGQFRDRLGDASGAFAAFERMNRLFLADPGDPAARADVYRARLRMQRAQLSADWIGGWTQLPRDPRSAPAFLVGFPRSGTTLLDTMLMSHPRVTVLEERPPLQRVADRAGDIDRLATLDAGEAAALRDLYWREVANEVGADSAGTLLVDKQPLHMTKLPLIARLFPDARIILALRHPCDVVLSCFITSFRPNDAMANFLTIETTAELYDLAFDLWSAARALLPVAVHETRYERLIDDPDGELRALAAFLDLEWRDELLDHRATAARRGLISTASYAQVTEPLYRRAAGRWQRYRDQLAPVLPMLQPWVERLGYSL